MWTALTFDDTTASARQQGIRRISDIEMAVLETDGRMSFFTHDSEDSGCPKASSGWSMR